MKKTVKLLAVVVLTSVICVSGYKIWGISRQYTDESRVKTQTLKYRPETPTDSGEYSGQSRQETTEPVYNQGIIDLQSQVNSDVVGWLTLPGTNIDYPFVMGDGGDYYLKHNIYREPSVAGTIFMDYRCAADFSDFNTVIYGHNMKNRSMFGDINRYGDSDFFDGNPYGYVFLADRTYTVRIFACLTVRADDAVIYNPWATAEEFYEYVRGQARNYREPFVSGSVVTLSTCSLEFDSARIVVIAEVVG